MCGDDGAMLDDGGMLPDGASSSDAAALSDLSTPADGALAEDANPSLADAGSADLGAADAGPSGREPPRILSVYFGADDIPAAGILIRGRCGFVQGGNTDGAPVVFDREIDPTSLDASDFSVRLAGPSGTGAVEPICATLAPADEEEQEHTVLLVGQFGSAIAGVDVVGDLRTQPDDEGRIHSLGPMGGGSGLSSDAVTPYGAGPSIVWAQNVSLARSECPAGAAQALLVIWEGGVTAYPGGDEIDAGYDQYRVRSVDGDPLALAPDGLVDLGDNDNNHILCLQAAAPVATVALDAGELQSPGGFPNPATCMEVYHPGLTSVGSCTP